MTQSLTPWTGHAASASTDAPESAHRYRTNMGLTPLVNPRQHNDGSAHAADRLASYLSITQVLLGPYSMPPQCWGWCLR
jgi:hypothetical protein